MKPLLFLIPLLVSACGDQTDSRLSSSDVAYIKAMRLQALYGTATATASSTVTITATSVSITTITSSSTH